MLPKDKSITTLLKSSTNRFEKTGLETAVQFIKGVGPRLGSVFNHKNIFTIKDLLFFFPRTYEDRSKFKSIVDLEEEEIASLSVRVLQRRDIFVPKLRRSILQVTCTDDTGILNLKWFYPPRGMEKRFIPGAQLIVTGKIKMFRETPEIMHPEITWGLGVEVSSENHILTGSEESHNVGRVVPIYPELEGISTRILRKVLWEVLEKYSELLGEDLPEYLLNRRQLPRITQALRGLHFPPEEAGYSLKALSEFATPNHHRLIYEEFFKFEFLILRQKLNVERAAGTSFGKRGGSRGIQVLLNLLPFRLTAGQTETLDQIQADFLDPHPMNRLVQGDVGSGKTAIAFLSAGCVLAEGHQAVLMAPTEILAEQHYKNSLKLFQGKLNTALLTGKTSGKDRALLQARLSAGEPLLVIGTHALIEDTVSFANLSYVMIDEQHRFGVEQRRALRHKGVRKDLLAKKNILPHTLILTATPIPRTLALTAFGDLSVSTIRELPPGRSPVRTLVVRDKPRRMEAYEAIRQELAAGRQAFFIYPLIQESEAEGFTHLKSAIEQAGYLGGQVFPGIPVGLLHGKLDPIAKDEVMLKFQKGDFKILVSTTVVEVGVDIPNASVMVIENAERFGLSQLHQLRGRVGRGQFQSYCYLFSNQKTSDLYPSRLEILQETNDGFKIAEADLELRGPGEFLGTRQAGALPFRLAHLVRDQEWLLKARDDAMAVIKEDPELTHVSHRNLRHYYELEGKIQFRRLGTA